MLISISAMATQPINERVYNRGVSRELAEWRKTTISDVRYELHFDLINNIGKATIGFKVEAPQEIVIDFRNTDLVRGIDGHSYRLKDEHIIIPAEEIVAGHNEVSITFNVDNQSLNRKPDFLYTLLVPDRARTLFPCFDQPNIKAEFNLSLTIPEGWTAVSNTAVSNISENSITFAPTEPLSTYLFSFVAGKFDSRTYDDGHHRFTAHYRETDPKRLAQLDTIFAQVVASLEWLEEYTGIDYPFAKYDLIMLPGFQYGGMEHTGATLYNDSQMFLGDNPTLDEELRRMQLIAHETAHMWFGDYVTMEWFNDVWTKEIFANYFAARMTEPLFPKVNHRLNRLKTYTQAAYSEDRTTGSTPIRQELDNLNNAGLIYGQIIYNKAPIVMDKIVEIMGDEAFRKGIQEYLRTYAYGNATWDDLVAILDKYTEVDIRSFSHFWVYKSFMPWIHVSKIRGIWHIGNPNGEGYLQEFNALYIYKDGHREEVTIPEGTTDFEVPRNVDIILPNSDGRGYGHFVLDEEIVTWLTKNMATLEDDIMRQSFIMMLNEEYEANWLHDNGIDSRRWLDFILDYLPHEKNHLIASTLNGYLTRPLLRAGNAKDEARLWEIASTHNNIALRRSLKMTLAHAMRSEEACAKMYEIWSEADDTTLNESDYMTLAYELAVRYPERYEEILNTQLARISNPDRCEQFMFIMRATHPDVAVRDALFESLMEPENRRPEPWTATVVGYLNHHLRQEDAVKYIRPALEELMEVQRTGDIFFPRNWVGALLGGHSSVKAFKEVCRFMEDNPSYPTLLMNKIEQASWGLLTSFKHESGDLDKLKIGERIFFNTKHIKRR